MKFTLEITCDNAAFGDDRNAELARILTQLAERIDAGVLVDSLVLRDINGNKVGIAALHE